MNYKSVAPCGLICDLCLGAQREKNRCYGCRSSANKPFHCEKCSIRNCPEKNGNVNSLCGGCARYPCRRIKDLEKRYRTKYDESLMENFRRIDEIGIKAFVKEFEESWMCKECGELLCVHRPVCLHCGGKSHRFVSHSKAGSL